MPESARALLAALVLAAAATALPHAAAAAREIELAYTITTDSAKPPTRLQAFDAASVGAFDLDGDGVTEILAHNDNNRAYVFDGATGALVAEIATAHPPRWEARELNGIAVGDVNGNGLPDLVIANSVGWVTAVEARPGATAGAPMTFEKLWETLIDPVSRDPTYFDRHPEIRQGWTGFAGLDGAAYLADVNGDGKDEAFVQSDNAPAHAALNADGSVKWMTDYGDGNGNPVVDDLDGDRRLEAVFATDGGRVLVYDAAGGYPECTFVSRDHGVAPASISVAPRIVDVDGDGRKDIVFGARQAVQGSDPDWMKSQHASYFAITSSCALIWKQSFEWGHPHVYMHPAVVDVDGDRRRDLVFLDWNTIGHKPGNWENTGAPNLFAVDAATGELVWRARTETYWSNKEIAIADVAGDDAPEILVVAPRMGEDGVTLYSLAGKVVGFVGVGRGWDVSRGPAVADLDGDGALEIVVPVHRKAGDCPPRNLDVGCREGAIRVFRAKAGGDVPWSGVFHYNRAYDAAGREPRAVTPGVKATPVQGPLGDLRVDVAAPGGAREVHVKRLGSTQWTPLQRAGDDWGASLDPPPVTGERMFVRVGMNDGRVGFSNFAWKGTGNGGIDGTVVNGRDRPEEGANVTVARDGKVLKAMTTDRDGKFRFEGPAGEYALRVTSDKGDRDAKLVLRPGELVRASVAVGGGSVLEAIPGPVVPLVLVLVLGLALAVVAGRPRH